MTKSLCDVSVFKISCGTLFGVHHIVLGTRDHIIYPLDGFKILCSNIRNSFLHLPASWLLLKAIQTSFLHSTLFKRLHMFILFWQQNFSSALWRRGFSIPNTGSFTISLMRSYNFQLSPITPFKISPDSAITMAKIFLVVAFPLAYCPGSVLLAISLPCLIFVKQILPTTWRMLHMLKTSISLHQLQGYQLPWRLVSDLGECD